MGESTKISWTRSTLNCWHGCAKVDALCRNCYAEVSTPVRVKRAGGLELWGANAGRSETKSWRADVAKWNRAAAASGEFWPVFAQSLSDTFEDARGGRVINRHGADTGDSLDWLRAEFFATIEACPALTFQLLTKRPENVARMVPPAWLKSWPAHVWVGTSVGDQESADLRIPHLLRVPAAVRFLSVEPQLGDVLLQGSRVPPFGKAGLVMGRRYLRAWDSCPPEIAWVICGGESGPKARPFDLAWARSLRDQCRAAAVPYFLKQLGARPVVDGYDRNAGDHHHETACIRDSHGANDVEWPADLRGCRAFPRQPTTGEP